MNPTDQGLRTGDASGRDVDFGLVVDLELAFLDTFSQLAHEAQTVGIGFIILWVEDVEQTGLTPCEVDGEIRLSQQSIGTVAVVRGDR